MDFKFDEIKVLDHGFVRLDDCMADDLNVVNSARVSFGKRHDEMEEGDAGLLKFLMNHRHGTPFEHNSFRFHVKAPIFKSCPKLHTPLCRMVGWHHEH